jgi:hypothetical protein
MRIITREWCTELEQSCAAHSTTAFAAAAAAAGAAAMSLQMVGDSVHACFVPQASSAPAEPAPTPDLCCCCCTVLADVG